VFSVPAPAPAPARPLICLGGAPKFGQPLIGPAFSDPAPVPAPAPAPARPLIGPGGAPKFGQPLIGPAFSDPAPVPAPAPAPARPLISLGGAPKFGQPLIGPAFSDPAPVSDPAPAPARPLIGSGGAPKFGRPLIGPAFSAPAPALGANPDFEDSPSGSLFHSIILITGGLTDIEVDAGTGPIGGAPFFSLFSFLAGSTSIASAGPAPTSRCLFPSIQGFRRGGSDGGPPFPAVPP
jgi:hypothetical protein